MANQLDIIIAQDQATYRNLVKMKVMILDARNKLLAYSKGDKTYFNKPLQAPAMVKALTAQMDSLQNKYDTITKSYNARQADLKTNAKSKGLFADASDQVRIFFTKAFNSANAVSGLGFVFLIPAIPIIWAFGVTAVTAIIAYFTEKHFSKSVQDYNESEKAAVEALKAGDPALANSILNKSAQLQADQVKANDNPGFFSQLGTGAKWAIGIGGGIVIVGVADHYGAFDGLKKKLNKKKSKK